MPRGKQPPRQLGEETVHRVHSGTGGGHEVEVPVGVRLQPGMPRGDLRRGVVVQDHMHGKVGRMVQKGHALMLAIPSLGPGRDLFGLHIQLG